MKLKLKQELHPVFETVCLTYLHYHYEYLVNKTRTYLNELEIDSDIFFRTHMQLFEQYRNAFEENYEIHPNESFFFEGSDENFILFLLTLLFRYPDIADMEESEIVTVILNLLVEDTEFEGTLPKVYTVESYIHFIGTLSIDDAAKWKFITLICSPQKWIQIFSDICKTKLPAYEYAAQKYAKEIAALISDCPELDNPHFEKIISDFSDTSEVYPTLAFPMLEWIGGPLSFYGILNPKVRLYQNSDDRAKEILLSGLKLIADKSKFEILCSLKERPKYNLEIAEQLHLTPPTMSHHMNLLLSEGFVTIEKKDGKVYYHLSPNKMEEILLTMKSILL